jgi:hypothetical protein
MLVVGDDRWDPAGLVGGTGKTHLAIARPGIHDGARGRCFNVVDLGGPCHVGRSVTGR